MGWRLYYISILFKIQNTYRIRIEFMYIYNDIDTTLFMYFNLFLPMKYENEILMEKVMLIDSQKGLKIHT